MDLAGITLEENLQRLASVPLLYEPGKLWRYSIATDVLGAVIEKVTGMPLSEAERLLVTDPLSMMDTDFKAVNTDRLTTAYADSAGEPRRLHDFDTIPFVEGTAGFLLSPNRFTGKDSLSFRRSWHDWKRRRLSQTAGGFAVGRFTTKLCESVYKGIRGVK